MQKALKKNTLAYQLGVRPLVQPTYRGSIDLPLVVTQLKTFYQKPMVKDSLGIDCVDAMMGTPEVDALMFYSLNHAVSIVRSRVGWHEPLDKYEEILETYHRELAVRSTRMFYYLLLICTRESRHERNEMGSKFWTGMKEKHGANIASFQSNIRGKGSMEAADYFMAKPPSVAIGAYTQYLVDSFYKGSYHSAYGGKAWGAIADCLHAYVTGVYSAEMMMDTAFTLCHNNGPIFNKGMLYQTYGHDIYKILDVQRSGQIPAFINTWNSNFVHGRVKQVYKNTADIIGEDFGGYVDWYQVEALGALKSYKVEQKAQVAEHGAPKNLKAFMEAEQAKKALALAKALEAEQKEIAKKNSVMFEVMPKIYVEITTRD